MVGIAYFLLLLTGQQFRSQLFLNGMGSIGELLSFFFSFDVSNKTQSNNLSSFFKDWEEPHISLLLAGCQQITSNSLNSFPLHRFPHIPFLEETRVVLKRDASSKNSYINANFISGYHNRVDLHEGESSTDSLRRDVVYIAAASPFDTATSLDFWRSEVNFSLFFFFFTYL